MNAPSFHAYCYNVISSVWHQMWFIEKCIHKHMSIAWHWLTFYLRLLMHCVSRLNWRTLKQKVPQRERDKSGQKRPAQLDMCYFILWPNRSVYGFRVPHTTNSHTNISSLQRLCDKKMPTHTQKLFRTTLVLVFFLYFRCTEIQV